MSVSFTKGYTLRCGSYLCKFFNLISQYYKVVFPKQIKRLSSLSNTIAALKEKCLLYPISVSSKSTRFLVGFHSTTFILFILVFSLYLHYPESNGWVLVTVTSVYYQPCLINLRNMGNQRSQGLENLSFGVVCTLLMLVIKQCMQVTCG